MSGHPSPTSKLHVSKLHVAGLAKYYGDSSSTTTPALQPTDLSIADGEFLTLLGPSGAGKTTLLAMVAGLTPPSSGRIWIDGRDVTAEPASRRDLGLVFQNYALFPHLSVYENIAFPLRMRKHDARRIERAVRDVLARVQLAQLAGRLPRELSGGQQQRIALARCLVYRPSIILMDEPLGALDKNLREHMQVEIKRLHAELGTTVLYVTHDQEEAFALSDRICLMNNARVEQIGTPAGLYFRPASVFAANFLGESNLVAGRLETISDGPALRLDANTVVALANDTTTNTHDASTRGQARRYAIGATVNGMLRPESIRLGKAQAPDDVALTATVRGVRFAGSITRIDLALTENIRLVAKMLTCGPAPAPGEQIPISWPREAMLLLPEATTS